MVENNNIQDIHSLSLSPFPDCTDFHADQSPENPNECQVGNVRGISIAATRGYANKNACTLNGNSIKMVDSRFGNVVIGIDIQGETQGVDISRNRVNLTKNPGQKGKKSASDKYIGLRVRSNVDGSTVRIDNNNNIFQGIENLAPQRRLRNKAFHGSPHGEIEWSNGQGCPFAKKRGGAAKK